MKYLLLIVAILILPGCETVRNYSMGTFGVRNRAHREEILKTYPEKQAHKIRTHYIWTGMTARQLELSRGIPDTKSYVAGYEAWHYTNGAVFVTSGQVTGWVANGGYTQG